MAQGDVVNDLDAMLTTATLDFQPASGVEVVITAGTSSEDTAKVVVLQLTDGSIASTYADCHFISLKPLKLFINNTNFLRRNNLHSGTVNVGFTGVQTK